MRIHTLIFAGTVAIGLSACVVVPATGTFPPTPGPAVNASSLAQQLSGRTISNSFASHRLLPNGQIDGRFFDPDGTSWAVPGAWSANDLDFCITVESEPLCGRAAVNGNQLLHYPDGPGQPEVWNISG